MHLIKLDLGLCIYYQAWKPLIYILEDFHHFSQCFDIHKLTKPMFAQEKSPYCMQ